MAQWHRHSSVTLVVAALICAVLLGGCGAAEFAGSVPTPTALPGSTVIVPATATSAPAPTSAATAASTPAATAAAAATATQPVPTGADAAQLAAGKKGFLASGCNGCHMLSAVGSNSTVGPSLNGIGKLHDAAWIRAQIANPCAPGHANAAGANYTCGAMPANLTSGATADAIAAFLAAQK